MTKSQERTSEKLRIVIVGGVAGGASAAARARRVNADAEIILLEKGENVSFANCGLPYHIGGEIVHRDNLLVTTPELFRRRFGIDVRTRTEAIAIDRKAKQVRVRKPTGDEQTLPYDRLILSPGAEPIVPPFLSAPLLNVSCLWSLPDMDRIVAAVEASEVCRAVVIGGGFVGLEVAEQLVRRGVRCTLVERNRQCLKTLDPEMAWPLAEQLMQHGIDLKLGRTVESLEIDDQRASGVVVDGELLEADLVVLALGIRPRTALAQAAGLEIGRFGGIVVDDAMRTSDPDIFAVGDCVELPHAVLGYATRVPLAGPANRAGRIAGEAAAGGDPEPMRPVLGTNVIRVFDLTAASTGLTEHQCKAAGLECRSVFIQAGGHASYYPGAETMTVKLIYTPEGKVLGAQAVGGLGVDKRIDVIATAIAFGGTVSDLAGLDLAYAPPYSSAKDPVHMAAFVACNDLKGAPPVLAPDCELTEYQVVDVRSAAELKRLPLAGAIAIPLDQLRERLSELDPALPTVTVCHSGKRGHVAASRMKNSGFANVANLTGGISLRSRFEAIEAFHSASGEGRPKTVSR